MLDGREKLRENFPLMKELQAQVQSARQELDEASVASKDFAKAGELHEEIDILEKKVEFEKSQAGEVLEVTGGKK